ncbi:hypothetical protein Tco_1544189, partial [Tanacetum coccineum]
MIVSLKCALIALIEVDGTIVEGTVQDRTAGLELIRVEVAKLSTGRLVNGSSCDEIDMVIKNLDFEPKIDAMMRDFL